jgi:hypothetical protein
MNLLKSQTHRFLSLLLACCVAVAGAVLLSSGPAGGAFFRMGGRGRDPRTSWLFVRRGVDRSADLRLRGSGNLRLPALLAALLVALGALVVPVAASAAPGET